MSAAASSAWRRWRSWPVRAATLWRRSLRFRTVLVTVLLTAAAIAVACVWMALAIQNDLFDSRRTDVLADARRATSSAQTMLDGAEPPGDRASMQVLMNEVRREIAQQSRTELIAGFRISGGASELAPQDFASSEIIPTLLTSGLRERVRAGSDTQWWQSVALPMDGTELAGIAVGQQLYVPSVGGYELFFVYDLADASQTLGFVQRTLWIAGIALVLIVAVIALLVIRSVVSPVVEAASTSARLADGDLGVRLQVRGDDELATLGRSFNAMADSIEAKIGELGELSLVQQRFVSDVSHELRTPLTTIRLAADILHDQRGGFDDAAGRAAELLHDQVRRFEVLLGDLLEISRYDAGSVQLELEPTALAPLVEDVVESMRGLAEQRGSELRIVAPGGHTPIDIDPRRVRRILRNLLGNAIEHGEGRAIVITVDSDANAAAVSVRDHGLGMSEEATERVFDRFWRADPSRKRTIGGTGLGLSIALGDARLHGGMIGVWSREGVGSNFVLVVPRTQGDEPVQSPLPLDPESGEAVRFVQTEPIGTPGDGRREGSG